MMKSRPIGGMAPFSVSGYAHVFMNGSGTEQDALRLHARHMLIQETVTPPFKLPDAPLRLIKRWGNRKEAVCPHG
jgi:hypothetical protein